MLFPAVLERCLRFRDSGLRASLLNLPCHRSAGDWGSGVPPTHAAGSRLLSAGWQRSPAFPAHRLDGENKQHFKTASSFWCGKFQRYTEIAHYNGPYVPFSQLQQWSVYSHLASFRSQPLLPHSGLFRSKSLTSYYFTSKYFYIHV